MKGHSGLQYIFVKMVGEGNGSGIAVMLLLTGVIGTIDHIISNKNTSAIQMTVTYNEIFIIINTNIAVTSLGNINFKTNIFG